MISRRQVYVCAVPYAHSSIHYSIRHTTQARVTTGRRRFNFTGANSQEQTTDNFGAPARQTTFWIKFLVLSLLFCSSESSFEHAVQRFSLSVRRMRAEDRKKLAFQHTQKCWVAHWPAEKISSKTSGWLFSKKRCAFHSLDRSWDQGIYLCLLEKTDSTPLCCVCSVKFGTHKTLFLHSFK